MNTNQMLFGFSSTAYDDWKSKAVKDLKGAAFEEKLYFEFESDLKVESFYQHDHQSNIPVESYIEAPKKSPLKLAYLYGLENTKDWELEGFDGFLWDLHGMHSGQTDALVDQLKDNCIQYFSNCGFAHNLWHGLVAKQKQSTAIHSLGFVPFAGNDSLMEEEWSELNDLIKVTSGGKTIPVELNLELADDQQTTAQKLAQLLTQYVLIRKNTSLDQLQIRVAINHKYLLQVAKLRSLRLLIKMVDNELGFSPIQISLISEIIRLEVADKDVYNQMIRQTVGAIAAVQGGVEAVCIHPFHPEKKSFAQRMSRNILLLLESESSQYAFYDPWKGSYYLENLTRTLAEKSWTYWAIQSENTESK